MYVHVEKRSAVLKNAAGFTRRDAYSYMLKYTVQIPPHVLVYGWDL